MTERCHELDFHADGEEKTAQCADINTLYNLEANICEIITAYRSKYL